MTRMTKKIHLAVLGTALTLNGCGQQPPPPVPIRVADGDWGAQPHQPPVVVNSAVLGTTHLIVQGLGAQVVAPGSLPLGTLGQALCAAGVAQGQVLPTVVFAGEGHQDEVAAAIARNEAVHDQQRHTTTSHHHRSGPGIIILGGWGGSRGPSGPVSSPGRTTTSRPGGSTSAPGGSSSTTSRGGFGSTGGAISGSSSS